MPKKIAPKVKYSILQKPNSVTAYVYLSFHYVAFGTTPERFRQIVPETKVKADFWDKTRQRLKLDRSDPTNHIKTNAFLDKMADELEATHRFFDNGRCTKEELSIEFSYRMGWLARPLPVVPVEPVKLSFFEAIEVLISEKMRQPRGTWKILLTVQRLLIQYANERRAGKLDFENVDFTFFNDFKTWLYAAPREHSTNYAAKVVSVLRQFMKDAQRRGYHQKTDYQNFTITKTKTTKIILSFDELEDLYNLDLTDNYRLEKVRDLFLIGAYTGLRFSDFTRIRPEHIETVEGEEIISITTQKTGQMVSIPLFSIPKLLLNKYNFLAPKMSNQKMNDYLKELGQLVGLTGKIMVTGNKAGKRTDDVVEKWTKLTTHVARRSFATNFYMEGTPIIDLMQITGHTTERQFMQYIVIDGKMNAARFSERRKARTLKIAG